jgi:hypothetical protein
MDRGRRVADRRGHWRVVLVESRRNAVAKGRRDRERSRRRRGRALPVVAAAAAKGSIDVYLNALGTVTPRNAVIVSRASTGN